eukprot:TRINITY_DN6257_c0_g1_i5.p1 TRINITY_DN6257_c0_g1~~TRINITY_DN6257_c0_g1_i5.p1  ORF type:complete len:315 (+),score=22.11 TRINITY_DN6257_c0_g1_i5:48-947(+)
MARVSSAVETARDNSNEQPRSAEVCVVEIVVRSLDGNEVLVSSVNVATTVEAITHEVAAALSLSSYQIGLQCGQSVCKRDSVLLDYIVDLPTEDPLEMTCVVKECCMFELDRFIGTGPNGMLKYEWNSDFDPADAFSILCWVRTNNNGYHYLVSRGEWTEGYSLGVLAHNDRRDTLRGCLGTTAPEHISWDDFVSQTSITPHTWHHCALVFDGENVHIYVNGHLTRSGCCGSQSRIQFEKTPLWIGGEALGLGNCYKGASPRHFLDGEMRKVTILSVALSEAQIHQEFELGLPPQTKGE